MIIVNFFIRIINSLLSIIGFIIEMLLLVFPNSPFQISVPPEVEEILAQANYFIPISEMVVIGEAWLVAITVYYSYSVYARWAKTIQ